MNDRDRARQLLACLDLTALGDDVDEARVRALCARARSAQGAVAAVCIPATTVPVARAALPGGADVKIATVANFPTGQEPVGVVVGTIEQALADGADELDVVLPYRLLDHDLPRVHRFLTDVRRAVGDRVLKVILETGEVRDPNLIRGAADLAIDAGADFLKTSTGKVPVNATAGAARILLRAIDHAGGHCGFKASGGIRTLEDAELYARLAEERLGPQWVRPRHFRIGASSLLDALLAALGEDRSRA